MAGSDIVPELGVELISFEQDDDGVTAKLLKHAVLENAPTNEDVRFDYLIGTDGARGEAYSIREPYLP